VKGSDSKIKPTFFSDCPCALCTLKQYAGITGNCRRKIVNGKPEASGVIVNIALVNISQLPADLPVKTKN
jgi:hypothetical protein